jgi:hypothetical protein
MHQRFPQLTLLPIRHRFTGVDKHAMDQQTFHRAAAGHAPAHEPRREDARVVDDENGPFEQDRQVGDGSMREAAARSVEMEQTRRSPFTPRFLRDQVGRQLEIEITNEHSSIRLLMLPLLTGCLSATIYQLTN